MIFQITIAEKIIEVHTVYDFSYIYCLDYLTYEPTADFIISIRPEEIEQELSIKKRLPGKSSPKKLRYYYGYTEFLILLRKISDHMPEYSTFLLHAAVVSDGEWGYAFSAPSGTGKTTRAIYLKKVLPDGFIINGDKPLIRAEENKVTVFGTPWCGKEYMGKNIAVPLRAIFLLERAEKTEIEQLTIAEALPYMIRYTYFSPVEDASKKTMALLGLVGKTVKIYRYRSTDNIDDVLTAYNMARKW